jgi:hypothetical protein
MIDCKSVARIQKNLSVSWAKHEKAHLNTHIFSVFLEIITTLNSRDNNRANESEVLCSADISLTSLFTIVLYTFIQTEAIWDITICSLVSG